MPGFGKAGISFLICIRLIVQGLAKKYRSEAESTEKVPILRFLCLRYSYPYTRAFVNNDLNDFFSTLALRG